MVDAYRAFAPLPFDAPSAALAAVVAAVRPESGLFTFSAPGGLAVSATGEVTLSGAGKHKLLKLDPAQRDKLLASYVELASMKPVVRAPRVRRQQAIDPIKPPEPPPPAASKP